MIRKILLIGAALAIPTSALAAGAVGAGVAGAGGTPPTPLNCSAAGTVTFAAPGLTYDGTATFAKTSSTTTSGTTFAGSGCGSGGSTAPLTISSKNTKCTGAGAPVPACTGVKKQLEYDSAAGYAGTGSSTLLAALKKVTLNVNGIAFAGQGKTASSVSPGGACGAEAGFAVSGKVKAKGYTYKTFALTVCLGTDTGSGADFTGDFTTDFLTEYLGHDTAITITGAAIDPASSTLNIS